MTDKELLRSLFPKEIIAGLKKLASKPKKKKDK